MAYNSYVDITERLETAAAEVYGRDKLYGMSTAALYREAMDEILRLRGELMVEMRNNRLASCGVQQQSNKNPPTNPGG